MTLHSYNVYSCLDIALLQRPDNIVRYVLHQHKMVWSFVNIFMAPVSVIPVAVASGMEMQSGVHVCIPESTNSPNTHCCAFGSCLNFYNCRKVVLKTYRDFIF